MTKNWTRRTVIGGLVTAALLLAAVPIVRLATTTNSAGVLEACINPGNGGMRLVNASTVCHNNETRVSWNIEGPAGPPGPTGSPGPVGSPGPPGMSAGGPPYVWICTPAHRPAGGGSPRTDVYVFNGGAVPADVSINILNSVGVNLLGHNIPGSFGPVTYPGDADGVTVSLNPANTRDVNWVAPAAGANPASDPDVAFSIRVTSNQPIVVGANIEVNGNMPNQCSLLPK